MPEVLICGQPRDNLLKTIENFHSHIAPGLVLGALMVDLAQELVGRDAETDAVVETRKCLPDAVQIFTPCTYGNGWMKVMDWNKFALALYDKKNFNGYRVWLDLEKTKRFPNLYNWFMKLVSKKDLPLNDLLETIFEAGRSVLSSGPIRVTGFTGKKVKTLGVVCPSCKEAYHPDQGSECIACRGNGYYESAA